MEWLPHSYKIIHKPTGQLYIGVVVKDNKTFLDRFDEHLNGIGSLKIKELIINGSKKSDFDIELIDYYPSINDALLAETELIKYYNSYKFGLNGNCGGGFKISLGDSQYCSTLFYSKTRKTHIQDQIENISKFQSCYMTDSEYKEAQRILKFSISYKKKCLGELYNETITTLPNFDDFKIYKKFKELYKLDSFNTHKLTKTYLELSPGKKSAFGHFRNTNGHYCPFLFISDKISTFIDDIFFKENLDLLKLKRHYASKNNNAEISENWLKGREKHRKRVSNKIFTENEIKAKKEKSKVIKEYWENAPKEERQKRTKAGLDVMNQKIECEYCGKVSNKGNYSRWHGKNCKVKNENYKY
jgi:hypothetical protein